MYEQYINKRFGKWTVLKYSHKDKFNHPFFDCVCDCGCSKAIDLYALKYGRSKSCVNCIEHHKKHGLGYSRIYHIFYSMRSRCYNPNNKAYKHYGGRGITICEEWLKDVRNFVSWSMNNGYKEDLTIDRIDFNKGYSPQNCRWADSTTQARNKRNNRILRYKNKDYTIPEFCQKFNVQEDIVRQRLYIYGITDVKELMKQPHNMTRQCRVFITIKGKTKSLVEWCKELGVSTDTIRGRIKKYGYTPKEALTIPLKNGKKNKLLSGS